VRINIPAKAGAPKFGPTGAIRLSLPQAGPSSAAARIPGVRIGENDAWMDRHGEMPEEHDDPWRGAKAEQSRSVQRR
jgi:hypothetical protein